jgi:hypothetical protein
MPASYLFRKDALYPGTTSVSMLTVIQLADSGSLATPSNFRTVSFNMVFAFTHFPELWRSSSQWHPICISQYLRQSKPFQENYVRKPLR